MRTTLFILLCLFVGCQQLQQPTAAKQAEIESNRQQAQEELARLQAEADASGLVPAELGPYYEFLHRVQSEYESRKVRDPVEASRWFLGRVKGKTLGDVMAGE